jgi:flavin reductase (DIM6/NTAB) family NADH-FMN oxidoreductase RutF
MANNSSPTADNTISPAVLRDALGCFPTGVAIVTTLGDDGAPVGLTINSFSSVSLQPALVLWSLMLSSPSIEAFRKHRAFAINILTLDQGDLCMQFARPADDKFANVPWSKGYKGVPVLDGALVTLECEMHNIIEGGDHEVYMGEVKRIHKTENPPLVFHRGQLSELAC